MMRLRQASETCSQKIVETVMNCHKNVKTVLAQTGGVSGDYRLRELKYIGGENRTVTVHKESGCLFSVDVEKCFFSPRLSYERMRIARQVRNGEVVVNMFAGVGCFSIIIARHSKAEKVYSIDVNHVAVQYMRRNVGLNRVYGRVIPVLGDAEEVVEKGLCRVADRVLMPLPQKAFEYLPCALLALKKRGGWIHYYDFEHARKGESAVERVKLKVSAGLQSLDVTFEIPFDRAVRATGPNWYQVVLDIKVNLLA
jgi:tRNA (guanine37-N1)-methyltransferase